MSTPGPSLVAWPAGSDRRLELAQLGAPCVLVLDAGTPIPVLLPVEDMVRRDDGEADAAVRLASAARATPAPEPPLEIALIASVPIGLEGDLYRCARRLLSDPGALVRWAPGERPDPAALRRLRRALGSEGWVLRSVGSAGHLVERREGPGA